MKCEFCTFFLKNCGAGERCWERIFATLTCTVRAASRTAHELHEVPGTDRRTQDEPNAAAPEEFNVGLGLRRCLSRETASGNVVPSTRIAVGPVRAAVASSTNRGSARVQRPERAALVRLPEVLAEEALDLSCRLSRIRGSETGSLPITLRIVCFSFFVAVSVRQAPARAALRFCWQVHVAVLKSLFFPLHPAVLIPGFHLELVEA